MAKVSHHQLCCVCVCVWSELWDPAARNRSPLRMPLPFYSNQRHWLSLRSPIQMSHCWLRIAQGLIAYCLLKDCTCTTSFLVKYLLSVWMREEHFTPKAREWLWLMPDWASMRLPFLEKLCLSFILMGDSQKWPSGQWACFISSMALWRLCLLTCGSCAWTPDVVKTVSVWTYIMLNRSSFSCKDVGL